MAPLVTDSTTRDPSEISKVAKRTASVPGQRFRRPKIECCHVAPRANLYVNLFGCLPTIAMAESRDKARKKERRCHWERATRESETKGDETKGDETKAPAGEERQRPHPSRVQYLILPPGVHLPQTLNITPGVHLPQTLHITPGVHPRRSPTPAFTYP